MCFSDSQTNKIEDYKNVSKHHISAAQFRELRLLGQWEGFSLSQSYETSHLHLMYDGQDLSVEEVVERGVEPEEMSLLDHALSGFLMNHEPIIKETLTSYKARLTWEHDGSLTWQSPHGVRAGCKVWKLDGSRSNENQLRWISEEGVFFWHRVPDAPVPDAHRLDNLSSCWQGVYAMLPSVSIILGFQRGKHGASNTDVLDRLDGLLKKRDQLKPNRADKLQSRSELPWLRKRSDHLKLNRADKLQSHSELPTLLGNKRQHMRVGIDVNQAEKSGNKLPNLLGNNGNHMKADKLLKQ